MIKLNPSDIKVGQVYWIKDEKCENYRQTGSRVKFALGAFMCTAKSEEFLDDQLICSYSFKHTSHNLKVDLDYNQAKERVSIFY